MALCKLALREFISAKKIVLAETIHVDLFNNNKVESQVYQLFNTNNTKLYVHIG